MKYALDFDSTVAHYNPGDHSLYGHMKLGDPIPSMVRQVKGWLRSGHEVVIYTARDPEAWDLIRDWTLEHIGWRLEVTNLKTWCIDLFIDDKARTCIANTGEIIDPEMYAFYKERSHFLARLENNGVDNWEGYHLAFTNEEED